MQIISLTLISLFFYTSNAQLFSSCPTSPINVNFDASRYVGKWYQIEHYSIGFEYNQKCVYAQYTAVNNSFIDVYNTGYNQLTNKYDVVTGYAFIPNTNIPNQLRVVLRVPIAGFFIENSGKYDVWSTDYDTYSLVYSCQTVSPLAVKVENVFILSRTKTLDQSILDNLKKMLTDANFDVSKLNKTTQDC